MQIKNLKSLLEFFLKNINYKIKNLDFIPGMVFKKIIMNLKIISRYSDGDYLSKHPGWYVKDLPWKAK
jgi:hypothetical protein